MRATIDQPTPISSRLAPVMLASASEHGEATSLPGAAHRLPNSATAWPGLVGEHEVDRVLREHGDEREERDRQPGGDVELRRLCAPTRGRRRRRRWPGRTAAPRAGWGRSGDGDRTAIPGTVVSAASASSRRWREGWTAWLLGGRDGHNCGSLGGGMPQEPCARRAHRATSRARTRGAPRSGATCAHQVGAPDDR